MKKEKKTNRPKRKWAGGILVGLLSVAICLTAAFGWIWFSNRNFEETFYTLYTSKINEPVRAVLLADLHQAEFGTDNSELITRIAALEPDVILIAGDMITAGSEDLDYAVGLCERLMAIAPVYFGLGNNENETVYGSDLNADFFLENSGLLGDSPENFEPLVKDNSLLTGLRDAGVVIVQNESVITTVNGNKIEIGGISTNLSSFWPNSGQFVYRFAESDSDHFKILISHRPDPVMEYIAGYRLDLVVSGHTHGGIVRIPGKGGLLSTEGGFFPEYDAGLFESGPMTMIVSRGLGEHGVIPRIFNSPELVVIDLN